MAKENSFKNLVICLGSITLVCGAVLAGIYVLTEAPIKAAEEAKTKAAISAVCESFASLDKGVASDGSEYYVARSAQGDTLGYVVNASSDGFGGTLKVMVGFRPDGSIYDTAVLSHSETPGLGAKCTDAAFSGQFKGFDPAVKALSVKKDGGDVDAITASTITSRAYCAALEKAVALYREIAPARIEPVLEDEAAMEGNAEDGQAAASDVEGAANE